MDLIDILPNLPTILLEATEITTIIWILSSLAVATIITAQE